MKNYLLGFLALFAFIASAKSSNCELDVVDFKLGEKHIEWIDLKQNCTAETKKQIELEIQASIVYLSYASHFSRDTVNRPGFAKFFFEAANEEREHAIKLIDYLSMRGVEDFDQVVNITKLLMNENVLDTEIGTLEALKKALKLETQVTKSIRKLIDNCENDKDYNHYHFVDYLTGEFLEEQYKGQRDIAGKISTLGKMLKESHSAELAEFLFDKTLL